MKATKQLLIKMLEEIKWSVRSISSNDTILVIINHKKEIINCHIYPDRVEFSPSNSSEPTACSYFKDCKLINIGKQTVCLSAKGPKSVFMLFHNFDIKDLTKENK